MYHLLFGAYTEFEDFMSNFSSVIARLGVLETSVDCIFKVLVLISKHRSLGLVLEYLDFHWSVF